MGRWVDGPSSRRSRHDTLKGEQSARIKWFPYISLYVDVLHPINKRTSTMSSLKVKTTAIGSEADPQRPNKKSLPVLTSISSTPQERQLVRPKSSEWAPPTAHQSHRKKRSESG